MKERPVRAIKIFLCEYNYNLSIVMLRDTGDFHRSNNEAQPTNNSLANSRYFSYERKSEA